MAGELNAQKGTYIANEWKDGFGVEGKDYTPITAERLNHIEQGIAANSQDLKTLGDSWDSASQEVKINSSRIKGVEFSSVDTNSGNINRHPGIKWTMNDGTDLLAYFNENGIALRNQTAGELIYSFPFIPKLFTGVSFEINNINLGANAGNYFTTTVVVPSGYRLDGIRYARPSTSSLAMCGWVIQSTTGNAQLSFMLKNVSSAAVSNATFDGSALLTRTNDWQ